MLSVVDHEGIYKLQKEGKPTYRSHGLAPLRRSERAKSRRKKPHIVGSKSHPSAENYG